MLAGARCNTYICAVKFFFHVSLIYNHTMAKGSLFWGKGRGKLGELVLSQLNGQQISRAYQPVVSNPKTGSQTNQRAIFANAVKFYKHATQNLFKFAYEDKRPTESYYNAFMRHNTGVAMLPRRESYNNAFYPALGNRFLLTQGSLPELSLAVSSANFSYSVAASLTGIGGALIADLSKILSAALGLADGDIITMVRVENGAESIDDEPSSPTKWDIRQIILDSNSSAEIQDVLSAQGPSVWSIVFSGDNNNTVAIKCDNDESVCVGAALIVSRIVSGSVKVGTSYLQNNDKAKGIYQASLQSSYRQGALNSWGKKSDAILQGSIVKETGGNL